MNNLMINEKISYFFNIAVFGLAFLIASLWRTEYLIYGAITLIYGIAGHVIDNSFHLFYDVNGNNSMPSVAKKVLAIINIVLFLTWYRCDRFHSIKINTYANIF